jgi:hypothetical protein
MVHGRLLASLFIRSNQNNVEGNFVYLSLDEYKTHYGTSFGRFCSIASFFLILLGISRILQFVFFWVKKSDRVILTPLSPKPIFQSFF